METDRAGRVTYVSRGGISAKYYYYPTGQLRLVRLGNGAFTRYEYDAAQRLLSIQHYAANTSNLLRMDYAYTTRDLIDTITETDDGGAVSVVSFTYDTRSRLLTETRTGEDAYDLTYTYDQGGNRLTKTAVNNEPPLVTETVYHYDLEDPATYQTKNNRLMYYEVFEDSQPAERVDYAYEVGDDAAAGNVVTTVRKPTDDPLYYGTGFTYNKSGELWIVTQKTWELAGEEVVNEQTTDITEFRGIGRARYMSRQRDVDTLLPIPESAVWHDYAGSTIYGDYEVDAAGDPIETMAHMPGLAQTDQITGETAYCHADQIGTTRLMTDDVPAISVQHVYTAFGEPIAAPDPLATRYGYAGALGYQTHERFSYLHVGHRYYDPSVGRFLQRDPLGILGSANLYAYPSNNPVMVVDPTGLAKVVVIVGGGEVLGTDALIRKIVHDRTAQGDDVTVIRTTRKKVIKAIVGDNTVNEIIYIGHGGGPSKGKKKDPTVLVPRPGISMDDFQEDITPAEVEHWPKGAQLQCFDARACYQGMKGHREKWQKAFGATEFRGSGGKHRPALDAL